MRRIWMLLFVLVLTVVVMAVPALAAGHDHGTCNYANNGCNECCDNFDHEAAGWKNLNDEAVLAALQNNSNGGKNLVAGKYYLSDDLTQSFTLSANVTVEICLNGHTLTPVSATRRTITVTNGKLKIVDCSTQPDSYISKGVIKGLTGTTATPSGSGGTVMQTGGTIYFYNGTITGGNANTGGNIYMQDASRFYLMGGQILGSSPETVTYGGTKITITDYADGGVANTYGGNVAVTGSSQFYMGDSSLQYPADNIPAIVGGTSLQNGGGNVAIWSANAHFYLNAGSINGGLGGVEGGNVRIKNGYLHITDGEISGGYVKARIAEGKSANLYMCSGVLEMSGGQIDGYVLVEDVAGNTNAAYNQLKLSGTAKIAKRNNNVVTTGVWFSSKSKTMLGSALYLGNFAPGAEIYLGTDVANHSVENFNTCLVVKDNENNFMTDGNGTAVSDWLAYDDATRYIHSIPGNSAVSFESNGIYLRDITGSKVYHCICCGDQPYAYNELGKIEHIGDCDGFDKCWVPYTINDGDLLPTTVTVGNNYIYLVEGGDNGDGTIRGHKTQQSAYSSVIDLYVDMNGLTYYSGRRIVRFDVADVNVTFTNSKSSGGFKFDDDFQVATYRYDGFATKTGSTLNFYRVNIDAEKYSPKGTFISVATGECNFYNSTIKCASPINNNDYPGNGGLATVGAAGSLKMVGCTVTGGSVTGAGGVLYLSAATSKAVLTDCTITGGTAAGNGGVIYTYGELTLNNCAISGGAATDGNNLYINTNSNVTINGGFVDGGVRTVSGSTLTLSGAVKINNGGTDLNSGIYLVPVSTFNVSGVTADADILLYLASPGEKKTGWCVAVEDGLVLDAFNLVNNNLYLVNAENTLGYVGNTNGYAALRNRVLYSASEAALAGAKNGDFVKLFAGAENATVNANITLDLNGQTVTNLGVAADKKISLFDSTGSSYGAPTGSVTLAAGTTADNFNREMLTGGVTDKNMRYVTVKVGDQVSAHRIYLSIKSVSLVAREDPGLGFRTVLRCDEDLAKLLVYGAAVRFVNSYKVACSIYTNIEAWDSENQTENSKLSGLLFDIEKSQLTDNVSTKLVANAYLIINDDFADYAKVTDEAGAKIAIQNGQSNALRSSTSMSVSLQEAVEATDVMYDDLADNLINGLTKMINKWQAFMGGWNIPNIKNLIEATE